VDIPDLSVSITPKSATSEILVMIDTMNAVDIYCGEIQLARNGTYIYQADAAGVRPRGTIIVGRETSVHGESERSSAIFLDSPNTTSEVTYKLLGRGRKDNEQDGGLFINRTAQDRDTNTYDGRGVSSITVMEIGESSGSGTQSAYSELDTDASRGVTTNADNSELPAFACRAFCTFDGTDVTTVNGESHCRILGSGNISKVVRYGTGLYTIHFKTPMPDDAYSVSTTGTAWYTNSGSISLEYWNGDGGMWEDRFNIRAYESSGTLTNTHSKICIQVFR